MEITDQDYRLLKEKLAKAEQRIAELEAAMAQDLETARELSRLATFPEQNPNLVIETTCTGEVTYLNPDARQQFPALWEQGFSHPLLKGLDDIVHGFLQGNHEYVAREVDLEERVYEQKICYLPKEQLIHVYAHDITARKQAEEEVKELAGQLRWLTQQLVLAQEEERRKVAHELHDEAGQALVALKITLELFQDELPPESKELRKKLAEAIALVDQTRNRMRMIARGLRPPELDTVGLNLALEGFCLEFSRRTHLTIQYTGADLPPLPDEAAISVYRILQEALTNAADHAQATQVRIQLDCAEGVLRLTVEDNGRGFPLRNRRANQKGLSGLGLLGMKERLELLNGRLEIDSAPGRGTRLVAYIPLEAKS